MIVKSTFPINVCADLEAEARYYEAHGFTKMHHIVYKGAEGYIMQTEDGSKIALSKNTGNYKVGVFAIWIQVDNLDDAIAHFEKQGYKKISEIHVEPSCKFVYISSEQSRFPLFLIQHTPKN